LRNSFLILKDGPKTLPIPAVCFVSCHVGTPGKINTIKELMVLPKVNTGIKQVILTTIHN